MWFLEQYTIQYAYKDDCKINKNKCSSNACSLFGKILHDFFIIISANNCIRDVFEICHQSLSHVINLKSLEIHV